MREHELDGMAAVNDGVANQRWPHTMDAQMWAKEFCKRFPDFFEWAELAESYCLEVPEQKGSI